MSNDRVTELFIEELNQVSGGVSGPGKYTTLALGEEDGKGAITLAGSEEGGSTMATGEESDGGLLISTTLARNTGEEPGVRTGPITPSDNPRWPLGHGGDAPVRL